MAEEFAVFSSQTNLVRESLVRFNDPVRRMVISVVRVVMTMRLVITSNKKFAM